METTLASGDIQLAAYRARARGSGPVAGVVLCHGFPSGPRGAAASASTFPELADRISREVGCTAVAFNCRGTGQSDGEFSIPGWITDIHAAVDDTAALPEVDGVWLVGVAEGGTFAVCVAAESERVRGVATLAAMPSLRDLAREAGRFVEYARRSNLLREPSTTSAADWGRALDAVDAVGAAARLPPRPLLVLHGSDDQVVSDADARRLADAAGGSGDLRIVQAAGHELRHDPRAIALLVTWLERERP